MSGIYDESGGLVGEAASRQDMASDGGNMSNREKENEWHLDKKVPLGIIVALIVQTLTLVVVGVTWKSDVDHRLNELEKTDLSRADNNNRITVLETRFIYIADALKEIKEKLGKDEKGR